METKCYRDEDFNSAWGRDGKTAKMKAAEECASKGYNNHEIIDCGNWKFKAKCSGTVPANWSRPISNEAAKELGFRDRNDFARDYCRKHGNDGIDPSKWKDHGNYNYSVQCAKVRWSDEYEGCDGADKIRFVSCDGWVENSPESCTLGSSFGTKFADFKRCGLGSSPSGSVPGKHSTACPMPAGPSCIAGQECFGVIERIKDGCNKPQPTSPTPPGGSPPGGSPPGGSPPGGSPPGGSPPPDGSTPPGNPPTPDESQDEPIDNSVIEAASAEVAEESIWEKYKALFIILIILVIIILIGGIVLFLVLRNNKSSGGELA